MLELNNKNKLFDLLAQGATVITPNNRLSGSLLQQYFIYCQSPTVDKPQCYPYRTALVKAFHHLITQRPQHSHPMLLNDAQCQHLWRIIIKSASTITYSEGLLRSIIQAWEHCQQWQIKPEDDFHHTPQTATFQRWWTIFNKKLRDIDAINEHQLIPYLINSDTSLFSHTVIWVCFDDFSPQQLTLQHYLSRQGVCQYRYDLKESFCKPRLLAAKDNQSESAQLMAWLALNIQKGHRKIGVVVPNLEQQSRALQRELLRHFDAQLFNISLGQPLSQFPLVIHALAWLNLNKDSLTHLQVTLLLQSPYLGHAKAEFISRSHYLQDSPLPHHQSIALKFLIQDIKVCAPELATLLTHIISYPENASPEQWIELFQARLNALGFPGDYGLSSENYQCLNRLTALFDEFRQLHLISDILNKDEAINALTLLTQNTIFQAQKTNAPIQISGMLEASGCEFDSLWVVGLTDQCLPQKTSLSAFIPPKMQRDLLMPHSLPERELIFAEQTLQRLIKGSTEIVFSYPKLQRDAPNLPCSLISKYSAYEPIEPPVHIEKPTCLMAFEDNYTLPLRTGENVSGGTSLLAQQAKCPFKAFAEHRLKAKPIPQIADGMNPKEKGILIHKIMELFWRHLTNQAELIALNAEKLNQYIDEAIQTAWNQLHQDQSGDFSELIQDIEYVRLKRLILSLLELEKQRPEFTVAALEESYTIKLANIDFKVRVDRIDQVGQSKWVIDYKSNLPAVKPWNEERPTEPQLLLYTMLDEEINTLLLMQLKTGNLLCSGLSETKQEMKGITTLKKGESWETRRNQWHEQLTLLAEEFQNGTCMPKPVNAALCGQCDFQNLCRYNTNQEEA